MKKLFTVLSLFGVAGAMTFGILSGINQKGEPKVAKAATETTVYYAVSPEIVGTYTVKLNVNFKGDGDDWHSFVMDKTSDTLSGNDVYKYTYTDAYDGVGTMQFQLYNGEQWISQQQPIGSWTAVDQFNGKVYVHDDGWHTYTENLETYIPMKSAFFTNWTDDAGSFRNAGANCWNGRPLNALGPVFDGCLDHEGWTGTLTSRKWNQTTRWIYFQYGCANNSHVGEATDVKLVFKLWASADAENPSYTYDVHNDTFSQTTLILRNFEIPEIEYNALNGDFYMSVDLVDGRENDYGANEFGYLHVNQTHQQVSDAQWRYFNNCVDGEATNVNDLRKHYYLNGTLRNGFVVSQNGLEESFDTQLAFNNNWVKDNYGAADPEAASHQDKAISNSTYRTGGWNLPFNNTNGFFKGWYGGGNDDTGGDNDFGYVASDKATYRFLSKPFVLPANGLVSVKMAGNGASLHLIDFENGADLAWVDCRTFKSNGESSLVATGDINVCTMVKHIINFSKYAGRTVQIGIADVANGEKDGGWQAAYFDELKANYAELPGFGVDVVAQTHDESTTYSAINDYYVTSVEGNGGVDYANNDGPDTDDSPLCNAYTVWKSYLTNVRGAVITDEKVRSIIGRNYCSGDAVSNDFINNDVKGVVSSYNDLSEDEKAVFNKSVDVVREAGTDNTVLPTVYSSEASYNILANLKCLAAANGENLTIGASIASLNPMAESNNSITLIVITASVIIAFGLAYLVLRKRKENK